PAASAPVPVPASGSEPGLEPAASAASAGRATNSLAPTKNPSRNETGPWLKSTRTSSGRSSSSATGSSVLSVPASAALCGEAGGGATVISAVLVNQPRSYVTTSTASVPSAFSDATRSRTCDSVKKPNTGGS